MSDLAERIVFGEDAFVMASQGELLDKTQQYEVYKLNTSKLRLAVWDNQSRALVVFDTPALAALAAAEGIEARDAAATAQRAMRTRVA